MLINGEWLESSTGATTSIVDPSNNEPVADVPRGSKQEARAAVEAAHEALASPEWRDMDSAKRGRILTKLSTLVRENMDEMARLETLSQGKTLRESKGDVAWAARAFEYFAGLADKIEGETIPVPPKRLNYTLKEPLGVTVHIVPWNYPIALASRSLAPALAAGNTVVMKPSELTPLTALKLGELAMKAGTPKGVVNVVTGSGAEIGSSLVSDKNVDGIVKELVATTSAIKVGPGNEESSEMGPLVSKSRQETVLGFIKDGVDEGAKLLCGGKRPSDSRLDKGSFLEPTIFADVTGEMKIGCDEVFGPVLSVTRFKNTEEVVRMANETDYGLYGGLWTNNLKLAHDVASRLEVGGVAINEYLVTFPQTPFGGYKDSGIGHENGIRALEYYTRTKNVSVNLS